MFLPCQGFNSQSIIPNFHVYITPYTHDYAVSRVVFLPILNSLKVI